MLSFICTFLSIVVHNFRFFQLATLRGRIGARGPNAQPLVGWAKNSGLAPAIRRFLEAMRRVREMLQRLEIAHQGRVQVKLFFLDCFSNYWFYSFQAYGWNGAIGLNVQQLVTWVQKSGLVHVAQATGSVLEMPLNMPTALHPNALVNIRALDFLCPSVCLPYRNIN